MKNQLTITLTLLLFLAVSCSYNKPAPGSNEIFVDFKSESPMVVNGPEDIFYYSDYIDSVVHEAEHVKQAMLKAYHVEDIGEPPAYTIGYLVGRMWEAFKQFL